MDRRDTVLVFRPTRSALAPVGDPAFSSRRVPQTCTYFTRKELSFIVDVGSFLMTRLRLGLVVEPSAYPQKFEMKL